MNNIEKSIYSCTTKTTENHFFTKDLFHEQTDEVSDSQAVIVHDDNFFKLTINFYFLTIDT